MREECQDFILRTHFVAALLSTGECYSLEIEKKYGQIDYYEET